MLSDAEKGIQKHMSGLKEFRENNRMIASKTKTKGMTFGKRITECVFQR